MYTHKNCSLLHACAPLSWKHDGRFSIRIAYLLHLIAGLWRCGFGRDAKYPVPSVLGFDTNGCVGLEKNASLANNDTIGMFTRAYLCVYMCVREGIHIRAAHCYSLVHLCPGNMMDCSVKGLHICSL